MNSNIHITTINKYFSRKKEPQRNIIRSKIVGHSPISINEANIAHKIKQIPYYSSFFSVLDDHEELNISRLNKNVIEKMKHTENIKYYLFKYSDRNSYDLTDLIYNSQTIKKLIFIMIGSFEHLLRGLDLLNKNNICFFDISPKNIVFLENYREKPVLSNVQFSLNIKMLNYNYFSPILNKLEDFTFQPLEIHILFYFGKDDMATISYSFINEFCENFVENLNILRLFSDNYKKTYKEHCIDTMRKYINLPRQDIIKDILERNNKWDVYGISILYLQIFGCISRVFSLKGTFISKILLALSKNIHPDLDKRMSLEETLNVFDKYMNEESNWCFVNKLDNSKLHELFHEFTK
jgi:hypothetical protein